MEIDMEFLENLFEDVVRIAKEDNVVTDDEQAILEKTRANIDHFGKLYEKAMEDNIITDDEYQTLLVAYKRIYKESEEEALRDEKLTKDEVNIIAKLAHTLFTP